MSLTTDPNHPGLGKHRKGQQNEVYLVLSDEEIAKGLVRPVRFAYIHQKCGGKTIMARALAETYARQPSFYTSTWCGSCEAHYPLVEFTWAGTTEQVGS